jgi:hypothetical protein
MPKGEEERGDHRLLISSSKQIWACDAPGALRLQWDEKSICLTTPKFYRNHEHLDILVSLYTTPLHLKLPVLYVA